MQIRHIGELNGIESRLARKVVEACDFTRDNHRLILNVAFNYGGRDEIVHAVQNIVRDGIPADAINEDTISDYIYTSDLPDPDLIIRTSGEFRLSNFLIWQGAYSEIYTTRDLLASLRPPRILPRAGRIRPSPPALWQNRRPD